ncbi:TonB-dependent siderophore receptor [Kordiimonas pumila]|uniref:TonB-dependent siderophore receptor n=1 Tax=Kordiimonas pumila TaxID=2161677 RepID=A0ABV7D806_9PROT|nr:TonB-dependent siderophore receptor [Kordiimonas pumila]
MRFQNLSHIAVLAATTALAPSGYAYAESSTASNKDITEIVVTATGETRSFGGSKTDTPLIELPQSVSVITREEMDLRAVHTVADALAYTAGVQSEASGIDSRVDDVTVRGFSAGGFSTNNNFVDGLRLPTGGQWTRTSFDPFGLQQIEVLKGPSGVLFGQVAPGGIVNLISKRPMGTAHGEVMLQTAVYTDFDRAQFQGAVDFGGPIDDAGKFMYRMVGVVRDGETQIDETSNSRYYIAPSFTWAPTADTSFTLLAQYQRDEGGSTFQFMPATGTLYESNGSHISLDTYIGEPDWNKFDRSQYLIGYAFEHRFNENLQMRQNLRYTHINTLYRASVLRGDTVTDCGTLDGCIPGQTINRRAVQGAGESDGIAVDTQVEGNVETGNLSHTLLAGFDYFHTEWEHYRDLVSSAVVLPLLDFYNPVYRGAATYVDNLSPQIYTETVSKQTGIYAQDQIAYGNLRVTLGGRYDWSKDDSYNPVTDVDTLTKADAFTWRTGAVYLFDNGFAPYASYSESFQPSSGSYFDGTAFDPTTGTQYEAGVRYQPPGSNAFLTFGAYEITQQNITTPDPDPAHVCGTGNCSVQTGEGRIRGLELEGKATLPFGMAVVGSATYMDSEITETNTASELGNELASVPNYMASLFVDYRFTKGGLNGTGVGGGTRYVGSTYGNSANTMEIPGYTLFDLFARYDFGVKNQSLDGLIFSVNVRNLTNKRYVATCTSVASCFYGSGRTVNIRLQYLW